MKIIKKIFKVLLLSILTLIVGIAIWLFIPLSDSDFNDVPRKSTQYWNLNTGSKIAYTHIQSKKDTLKSTILYLHGGPGGYIDDSSIDVFEEISKEGYDIYLYDQIGSGLSARLDDPSEYSLLRHTADLKEIVNKIKAENLTLIGQSWGGFLATYYATYNPNKIHTLILSSPGAIKPIDTLITSKYEPNLVKGLINIDDRVDAVNAKTEASLSLKEALLLLLAQQTGINNIVSDETIDGVFHKMSTTFIQSTVCDTLKAKEPNGRPGMYSQLFTSKSLDKVPNGFRADMKQYKNPILILKGACDYIPWQETYEYKEIYPFADLQIIENAGHSIYNENPKDYIEKILGFLEKNYPN